MLTCCTAVHVDGVFWWPKLIGVIRLPGQCLCCDTPLSFMQAVAWVTALGASVLCGIGCMLGWLQTCNAVVLCLWAPCIVSERQVVSEWFSSVFLLHSFLCLLHVVTASRNLASCILTMRLHLRSAMKLQLILIVDCFYFSLPPLLV